ncbi:MAG: sodium:proton antiporter [Candidatus Omnitrophica bacterium]|nr:sodium:proton antiporter [Candidatus Omnitrophota bacterium]
MIYLLCFVLFGVGIYGLLVKKNIIKIIMSTMISSYAIHIFLIASGFRWHGRAPVLDMARKTQEIIMVDPLPQTLVLISIIVGAAVTSLFCVVAIRLYQKFGTFDISEMKKKMRD